MRLIKKLVDNQFEKGPIDHNRNIVRAIAYSDQKQIAFISVCGDDIFGHREYYETPGGGVNKGETLLAALKRELLEETGYEIDHIQEIGIIDDYYNLIHRHNINHYYLCHLSQFIGTNLEEYEKKLLHGVVFVDINKAYDEFNHFEDTPISILIKQRELPIIKIATKMLYKL